MLKKATVTETITHEIDVYECDNLHCEVQAKLTGWSAYTKIPHKWVAVEARVVYESSHTMNVPEVTRRLYCSFACLTDWASRQTEPLPRPKPPEPPTPADFWDVLEASLTNQEATLAEGGVIDAPVMQAGETPCGGLMVDVAAFMRP